MKIFFIRTVAMIVVVSLTISLLTGCSKKSVSTLKDNTIDKEHVFNEEVISLIDENLNLSKYYLANDKIYALNNRESTVELVSLDNKGNASTETTLDLGEDVAPYVEVYTLDAEGNVWYVCNGEEIIELVKCDRTGNILVQTDIAQLDPSLSFLDIECDSAGNVYLDGESAVYVFNAEGNYLFNISEIGYMINLVRNNKGDVYQCVYDTNTEICKLVSFDLNQQAFSDAINFKCDNKSIYNVKNCYPGKGYDIYVDNGTSLYGCKLDTGEAVELIDWFDSDIDETVVSGLYAVSSEQIYAICGEDDYKMFEFNKVAPENVKEKTVITLATTGVDTDLANAVVEFNKQNSNFRIQVTDYSLYSTEEDEYGAVDKMNSEMVSGNVPDIIVMNLYTPYESYVSKGLLYDLNELIEKDSEFSKSDYLENIFKASEVDGKLYEILPSLYVQTLVGKEKYIGDKNGWSIDSVNELFSSGKLPENMELFPNILTQQDMLKYIYMASQNQFLDLINNKCNYNNDNFKKVLEFSKKCPAEINGKNELDEAFYEDYCTSYSEDRNLLDSLTLTDFWGYHEEVKTFFGGENITMVGFPSDDENGQIIYASSELAISAKSDNKDIAWNFIKFFLSDTFQVKINNAWPVNLSALNTKAEKAMKKGMVCDDAGNELYSESLVEFNGGYLDIGPATQEEVDKVMEYLKSQNKLLRCNQSITNIIKEEAGAYFRDEKTVDETMDLIQNRIQNYVNESK